MAQVIPPSTEFPYGHVEEVDEQAGIVYLFSLDMQPLDPPSRSFTPDEIEARAARAAQDAADADLRVLRDEVRAVKDALKLEQDRVQAVLDTPNADINTKPAPYIVAVARAVKRSNQAVIALSRLVG